MIPADCQADCLPWTAIGATAVAEPRLGIHSGTPPGKTPDSSARCARGCSHHWHLPEPFAPGENRDWTWQHLATINNKKSIHAESTTHISPVACFKTLISVSSHRVSHFARRVRSFDLTIPYITAIDTVPVIFLNMMYQNIPTVVITVSHCFLKFPSVWFRKKPKSYLRPFWDSYPLLAINFGVNSAEVTINPIKPSGCFMTLFYEHYISSHRGFCHIITTITR